MIDLMIKYEFALPIIYSFIFAVLLGPVIIPILRRIKCGQTVRDDGPESHLKKSGTPTMGGIIFIVASIIPSAFFAGKYPEIIPVLILTIGMGLIGFLDDYIKVVLKRSLGLRAWQKLALQLILTGAFLYYLHYNLGIGLEMKIPFWRGHYLDLGIFNIPLLYFVVLGTDNAVNLTDGLDGLASTITIIVAAFFALFGVAHGSGVAPMCCALVGGLLGFLMFNSYPAKVFMGDTGSLALGGFIVAVAYVLQLPLFLVIIGIVYVCEALSVLLQVGYFKLTHGKRIFKMAPIHHHFELCGWSETRVVTVFAAITFLFCLIGIVGAW